MTEEKISESKAVCARNRGDDALKNFIEFRKREIAKLETFLSSIDWEKLSQEQEFHLSGVVSDLIKANSPQHRLY